MEKRCSYGFGRTLDLDFGTTVRKLSRALEERGFSILFRTDMWEVSPPRRPLRPYLVIGACPAGLSLPAFAADQNIGLMVPCPIAVYAEEDGRTTIMVLDKACLMDLLRAPAAIGMLMEHREQLEVLLEDL